MFEESNEKKISVRGKQTVVAISLILLLAFSAFMVLLPTTDAHTPAWAIPTFAYVTVAPNPVGVNQQVTLIFWLNQPPPTAGGSGGDRWRNITIEVTKPDSTKQMLGPFNSDTVGSSYTLYTPDQIGEYVFNVDFPGQTLLLTSPEGIPGLASDYVNDTYLGSTASVTLKVQQDPIPQPPSFPLPIEYWTHPIEGQNSDWESIASNWLSSPGTTFRIQPYGVAPDSAHILWTKPFEFGGVVGGSYATDGMTYYSGLTYENKFQTPIIINGRLFYEQPLANDKIGGGYECLDLRTGEVIWEQSITGITFGQLFDYESLNQHGVIPNGYLWKTVNDPNNGGTVWMAYDAFTGSWLFNETNVPSGTQTYGPNGEILVYQMNYAERWLALWNNTAAPTLAGDLGTGTGAFQWRPNGKNVNASTAYSWNVTIPELNGLSAPSIVYVINDDLVFGSSSTFPTNAVYGGTQNPYTLWAISLKPETRGQLLWLKNYTAPENNITRTLFADPRWPLVDPQTRMFVMHDDETMQNWGYSLDTGEVMWGPTPSENEAWGFYFSTGGILSAKTFAYGNFYSTGYSGILYCYDMTTGVLKWTYGNGGVGNSTNSGLATPYGNYPLGTGAIADGKIYLFSSEHSPNSPYWKGATMRCVDAYTGEELWSLYGYAGVGSNSGMAVADGVLVYLNNYDMQLYAIGKGPSKTTVSIQNDVIAQGNSVLIKGSVIDTAAGTNHNEQAARFPSGVPAVSDDSMDAWMNYVYMQKPKPTDVTGVEVSLTVTDPDGGMQNIGTATSDDLGNYAFSWTPPASGLYTVTATFEGSRSYYGSKAGTAFVVSDDTSVAPFASTQSTLPSPAVTPPTSNMPAPTFIAITVVVVIIVVAAAVIFRRHKF